MHNASTFSPAGTCGAIPSRPLRRRSWCPIESPVGALPTQPTRTPGRRGWPAPRLAGPARSSLSPPQVSRRERNVSRGFRGAEGAPASFQCAHLGVPPAAASSSVWAPRDSARTRSRSLGPPALRPLGTGPPPAAFRNKTAMHRHTHNAQSRASALGLGAPGAISSFPLPRRRAGRCSAAPGQPRGKGKSREAPAGSGRRAGPAPAREPPILRRRASERAGGQALGSRALERSRVRAEGGSTLAAAAEGGERRRNWALGGDRKSVV